MKNIKVPVYMTTGVLMFYSISPYIGFSYPLVFSLFMLVNFMTVWMVIRVLKDGEPSKKTFDDSWYDDVQIERVRQNSE